MGVVLDDVLGDGGLKSADNGLETLSLPLSAKNRRNIKN